MGTWLVVGFRVTGLAVTAYLRRRGDRVVVVEDDPTDERRRQAAALGVHFVGRPDSRELRRAVQASRLVVPSPGIPVSHPVYRLAAEAGVAGALRTGARLGAAEGASRVAVPRALRHGGRRWSR